MAAWCTHWRKEQSPKTERGIHRTIKTLITLLAILFLSGCTMYSVEKVLPDGSSTKVYIKSTRSFEQPNLHYERGDGTTFDFQAANADNNTDAFIGIFGGMMAMMQQMMQQMGAANVQ